MNYVGDREVGAPPEYPRETIYNEPIHDEDVSGDYYEKVDIIELSFPFDIKKISIFSYGIPIYPTDDIGGLPAGESIYVSCKLHFEKDEPAFVVKCKTFRHEYREYAYIVVYKYSGGFSGYRLKMITQNFVW